MSHDYPAWRNGRAGWRKWLRQDDACASPERSPAAWIRQRLDRGLANDGYSAAKLARRVAYAFQNPDEQLFRQRVWDEVAFGPQNLGYDPSKVKGLVEQALGWMELGEEADFNPRDLGFAGRKRVSLAAALAMDTPVMVFDEPTAGLDASELELLAKVLKSLRKEKTVLVISHDMDFCG